MKKIRKLAAVILAAVTAVVMISVPASAAGSFSSAKTLKEGKSVTMKATATKRSSGYLKIIVPDAGKLKFSIGSQKTTASSVYVFYSWKGRELKSGKISELSGKSFTVSKEGTYYLKITLQKGEYLKKLKYTFTAKGSSDPASGEWLKDYKLTDNEITQLSKALVGYPRNRDTFFSHGKITEKQAIDWLVMTNGAILNPYSYKYEPDSEKDPLMKFSAPTAVWTLSKIPQNIIDDTIYHLFGIKATHKFEGDNWYFYNGYFYLVDISAGCFDDIVYNKYERTGDGRFIAGFVYRQFVNFGDDGAPIYNDKNIFVHFSVHQANGKNYVRIHGIYKAKPAL